MLLVAWGLGMDESIGQVLKRIRLDRGWSTRVAGQKLGISYTRVNEVELGVSKTTGKPTKPTIDFLIKAARGYNIPLTLLLQAAGLADESGDEASEAEFVAVFRRLTPRSRDLALALLRTIEARDDREPMLDTSKHLEVP